MLTIPLPGRRLAAMATAAIAGALLLPRLPAWTSSPWAEAVLNGAHAPVFLVLTLLFDALAPGTPGRGCWWRPVCLGAVAALAVEVVQMPLGRSASFGDLLLGWGGVAAAAVILARAGRGPVTAAVSGCLLLSLVPLGLLWEDRARLRSGLPRLGNDPGRGWSRFWVPQGGTKPIPVRRGNRWILRVETAEGGSYEGVSFWPGRQDWSGWERLRLELVNPGEPFELGLRIDDRDSGAGHAHRFHGLWEVGRGRQTLALDLEEVRAGPAEGTLDLEHVTRLGLFTGESQPGRVFELENAFLD